MSTSAPVLVMYQRACYSSVSLNTARALSSKTFLRSAALSHSMFSIIGFTLSMERPVAGSTEDPTPGHSVPNRQRSAPTVFIRRRNASSVYVQHGVIIKFPHAVRKSTTGSAPE